MIPFAFGFILGAVAALLVVRNNSAKASELSEQGRKLLDALKGGKR